MEKAARHIGLNGVTGFIIAVRTPNRFSTALPRLLAAFPAWTLGGAGRSPGNGSDLSLWSLKAGPVAGAMSGASFDPACRGRMITPPLLPVMTCGSDPVVLLGNSCVDQDEQGDNNKVRSES